MTDIRDVPTPAHDDRLERYLLGLLDEPARESVEAEAFGDPVIAAALDEIETTLVDGYVHGTLDATRRDALARVIATHCRLQARVRVAQAITDWQHRASRRPLRSWLPLLAAAALLFVASLWTLTPRRSTLPPVVTTSDDAAAPRDPSDALSPPPAPTDPRPERLPPPDALVARPLDRSVFAVTLGAGVTRAADITIARVPSSATHVELRVPIAVGDNFPRYRLRVTDAAGRVAGVGEFASLERDRTVKVLAERGALADGLYDVRVDGLDAAGLVEPLSLQQVRITLDRTP